MRTFTRLLVFLGGAAGVYALAARPRLLRWGATEEEVHRRFPGAEIIPGGHRSATMAVTIEAEPARVWPWLVQMGYDRGGWYSWDRLDNGRVRSADRIHPEWQHLAVGEYMTAWPGMDAWEVAALEPGRFLGLRAHFDLRGRPLNPAGTWPRFSTDSLWGFLLKELPGGRTRLVVSGYWALRPAWLRPVISVVFLEPAHWIMQVRQFANLKRSVERPAVSAAGPSSPDNAPAGEAIVMGLKGS